MFGGDLGYYYYQHPLWFGSFWEKLGALVTLTDSTAYFVDTYVGEQIAHRRRHLARLQHRVRGPPQQLPRRHHRR